MAFSSLGRRWLSCCDLSVIAPCVRVEKLTVPDELFCLRRLLRQPETMGRRCYTVLYQWLHRRRLRRFRLH